MINLPSGVHIHNLIDDLRIFSWEAHDIFLHYSEVLKESKKNIDLLTNQNKEDPVTLVDLKINDLIIKRINQKYRDISWDILSEENAKIESNNVISNSEWLWILDPLDGTKDFIQGTKDYAMHLALSYKGRPTIAVVLVPNRDELWFANGEETWCEGRNSTVKKYFLSKRSKLDEMTLVRSKNHSNKILETLINKINFDKTIVMGSIGCKIASIIRGESDIYICLSLPGKSSPKDWDFAAPEAILKCAGGDITNLENESLSYNNKKLEQNGIIIATGNKETHKDICLQIKEIIKKIDLYPLF